MSKSNALNALDEFMKRKAEYLLENDKKWGYNNNPLRSNTVPAYAHKISAIFPITKKGLVMQPTTTWTYITDTTKLIDSDFTAKLSDETIEDIYRKLSHRLYNTPVIIRCGYCHEWAAVATKCGGCGAMVGK